MSDLQTLRVHREHNGRLLRITLNAPKANILTRAMMREIRTVLEAEASSSTLSAIAFEGEGKHFSFGASVEEHTRDQVGQMLPEFHGLFRFLASLDVPLVALVRGQCLGGGLELAAFCDFLFAEHGAYLGVPEIKLGVFPPLGAALLHRRVGPSRAADLVLTGTVWSAEQAREAGLVSSVSESGQLGEDVSTWFEERLLPLSASSLRIATRAARRGWMPGMLQEVQALEELYLEELVLTPDANEGIAAFLARREPVWTHGTPEAS